MNNNCITTYTGRHIDPLHPDPDMIYQKYLGSPLNAKEEQLLKEIDDDMLWFDLTYLLNEPQEREAPEIHITIDYTVRAFEETEKEYLELYSFFTH